LIDIKMMVNENMRCSIYKSVENQKTNSSESRN